MTCCLLIRVGHAGVMHYPWSLFISAIREIENSVK